MSEQHNIAQHILHKLPYLAFLCVPGCEPASRTELLSLTVQSCACTVLSYPIRSFTIHSTVVPLYRCCHLSVSVWGHPTFPHRSHGPTPHSPTTTNISPSKTFRRLLSLAVYTIYHILTATRHDIDKRFLLLLLSSQSCQPFCGLSLSPSPQPCSAVYSKLPAREREPLQVCHTNLSLLSLPPPLFGL